MAGKTAKSLVSTETLTSLAMLKVHVDQQQDYLDYLCPFVLQTLVAHKPDPVKDVVVQDLIRTDFGLEIPRSVVQVVLKRLAHRHPLKWDHGSVYRINGELQNPGIAGEKAAAGRHIQAVLSGLIAFSKDTSKPLASEDEAVTAICSFLVQFNIPCLRAYLRGTAIPTIKGRHRAQIVLVGKYVLNLQDTNPERFESFLVVLTGHMLANALLCPDLKDAPKTYRRVTFYLDTPLLIQWLGLDGGPRQAAVKSLVESLHKLGGTVATFSHLRDELESVIRSAAKHVESWNGRGAMVAEARRRGTTMSDMLVLAGRIDDDFEGARIKIHDTPRYVEKFQIDETAFKDVLDDEVSYLNPRAREHDINSVRSIYVLRAGTSVAMLERAKAVLVTSNAGFARAAFEYGQSHIELHNEFFEVSSVITNFSLANMAWLKAPLDAPGVPVKELLAFAYAALKPSRELLEKYLNEIDRLERQGKITARDHQLLRSSQVASNKMMNMTLGEEEALTEKTITETLKQVTEEIQEEESEKYERERSAHEETRNELAKQLKDKKHVQVRLYRRCRRQAAVCAWCASAIFGLVLAVGLAAGVGLQSSNRIIGWMLSAASGFVAVWTLGNLIFGTSVRNIHEKVQGRCLAWFIRRKSAETGLDFSEPE